MSKYSIPSIKDLARHLADEKRGQKAKSLVTVMATTQKVRVIVEPETWRVEVADTLEELLIDEAICATGELGPTTNTEKLARQLVAQLKELQPSEDDDEEKVDEEGRLPDGLRLEEESATAEFEEEPPREEVADSP